MLLQKGNIEGQGRGSFIGWNDLLKNFLSRKTKPYYGNKEKFIEAANIFNSSNLRGDVLSESVKDLNQNMIDYFNTVEHGTATWEGYTKSVDKASGALGGFSIKSAAASVAAGLLNTAINMGITLLAGAAISGFIKLVDNIINHQQKLIDAGKEAQESISDTFNGFSDNKKSISDMGKQFAKNEDDIKSFGDYFDSIAEKYDELHDKVNRFTNANEGLSDENYQSYLDISNQIADMFPQLVSGYDAQGNAILDMGNSADAAAKSMENLYNAQMLSANIEIGNNLQDVYKGVTTQINQYEKQIESYLTIQERAKNAAELFTSSDINNNILKQLDNGYIELDPKNLGDEGAFEYYNKIVEIMKDLNIGYDTQQADAYVDIETGELIEGKMSFNALHGTEEQLKQLAERISLLKVNATKEFSNMKNEASKSISATELMIKEQWKSMSNSLSQYLQTSDTFTSLSEDLQNAFISNLGETDYSVLADQYDGKVLPFLYAEFIQPMSELKPEAQQALSDMLSLNPDEMNLTDYKTQVSDFLKKAFPDDKRTQEQFKKLLGIDTAIKELDHQSSILKKHFSNNLKEISAMTGSDRQIAYDIAANNNFDLTFDELMKRVAEARKATEEPFDIKATPLLDAYNTAEETENAGANYDKIKDILEKTKELYNSGDWGTDDFKTGAAIFSPTGSTDSKNFEENLAKAERYLTDDNTGLINFLNDLESKGFAELNEETQEWTYSMSDLQKAADDMGMSFDWFMAMFGKLEDKGFSNNFFSTQDDGIEKLKNKYSELADEQLKLSQMENGEGEYKNANQTAIDAQREKVQGLLSDIGQVKQALSNLASQSVEDREAETKSAADTIKILQEEKQAVIDAGGEYSESIAQSIQDDIDALAEEYHIEIKAELEIEDSGIESPGVEKRLEYYDKRDSGSESETNSSPLSEQMQLVGPGIGSIDEIIADTQEYLDNNPVKIPVNIENNNTNNDAGEILTGIGPKKNSLPEQEPLIGVSIGEIKNREKPVEEVQEYANENPVKLSLEVEQLVGIGPGMDKTATVDGTLKVSEVDTTETEEPEMEVHVEVAGNEIINQVQEVADNTPIVLYREVKNQDDANAVIDEIQKEYDVPVKFDIVCDNQAFLEQIQQYNTNPENDVTITLTGTDESVESAENVKTAIDDIPEYTEPVVLLQDNNARYILNNIESDMNRLDGKVSTITIKTNRVGTNSSSEGEGNAHGTPFITSAHFNDGFLGHAYAKGGTVGEPKDTEALTGELGRELVVRGNRFFTVGDNGPEFVQLKKNDIIFNHKQTEELLSKGYTHTRGRALAQGNARSGIGSGGGNTASLYVDGSTANGLNSNTDSIEKNTDATDENTKSQEESKQTYDWIQNLLKSTSKKLEYLSTAATDLTSAFKKTILINAQMVEARKNQKVNEQAATKYAEYMQASSLDNSYKEKVRNGTMDIESIDTSTDEGKKLQELIQEYQDLYDKMQECTQAAREYSQQQAELFNEKLQNRIDSTTKKIDQLNTSLENTASAYELLAQNGNKTVQDLLSKTTDGKKAVNKANTGNSVQDTISTLNQATYNDLHTKAKVAKTAESTYNKNQKTFESQDKKYNAQKKKQSSMSSSLRKEYAGSLSKEQKNALKKGLEIDLSGFDPNSKQYKDFDAWNKQVRKTDLSQQKRNAARDARDDSKATFDSAQFEYAEAKANYPAQKLQNISDAYGTQRNLTSARMSNAEARITENKKTTASDYDKIIGYADQDARDAKAEADAYEKEMNAQIKSGKLTGTALKEAQTELANKRQAQKEAEDKSRNYRLEQENVQLTQLDRNSQKANNAITNAQNAIDIKKAKGIKITAKDYAPMEANAIKDIDIQKDKIAQLEKMSSMVERGSDKWREYQDQIQQANEAIAEQEQNLAQWQDEVNQITLDNLDRQSQKLQTKNEAIQDEIKLRESRGEKINASDYNGLIKNAEADNNIQQEKIDFLKELQSGVQRGSDEWREYQDQIDAASAAIRDNEQAIEDWIDTQDQIRIDDLQFKIDQAQRRTTANDAARQLRQTQGFELGAADYKQMIADSMAEQKAQEELKAELLRQQADNKDVGGAEWKELQSQIDACDSAINAARNSQLEYNNELNNLPITKLEKQLELLDAIANVTNSEVSLKQAQGQDLSEQDYLDQMQNNTDQIVTMQKERFEAYQKYMQAVAAGGAVDGKSAEEWKKTYLRLDADINNAKADNEELKDSLRDDVYWRDFERAHDAVQRLRDNITGMGDLITDEMKFDKDGNLTDMGYTSLALNVKDYEAARKEVQNYTADIANLNKLYSQGKYTQQEYTEKLAELQKGLLDSAADMKELEQTMIEYYRKTGQAQLDALFELIDARKEDLDRRKEAYNWSKQMRDSNKEVQDLDAQIAAYKNLGDAATEAQKAKLAQLEAQREEKQQAIDDAVQEHMFELSSQGLDDLKENLQEAFDESMEDIARDLGNITELMKEAKDVANANASATTEALNRLLGHYGIDPVATSIKAGTGFASGGIIRDKNGSTMPNGDNTWIRVNPGETILTQDFTALLPDAVNVMERITDSLTGIQPNIVPLKMEAPIINNDYSVTVQGDVDKEVWPGVKKMSEIAYKYGCEQNRKNAADIGIKPKYR